MYAIEINGLCKSFRGMYAVNDLSLKVPVGAIYGFIGENRTDGFLHPMFEMNKLKTFVNNGADKTGSEKKRKAYCYPDKCVDNTVYFSYFYKKFFHDFSPFSLQKTKQRKDPKDGFFRCRTQKSTQKHGFSMQNYRKKLSFCLRDSPRFLRGLAPSASALGELLQSFIRSQSSFLPERLRVLLLRQAFAFSCELHLTLFNLM